MLAIRKWSVCLFSPEWVFYSNVAVNSNSQQTKDGALGEDEDEAGDEEAAKELSAEASTAGRQRMRIKAQRSGFTSKGFKPDEI